MLVLQMGDRERKSFFGGCGRGEIGHGRRRFVFLLLHNKNAVIVVVVSTRCVHCVLITVIDYTDKRIKQLTKQYEFVYDFRYCAFNL